jgi:hypothetical protein
MAFVSEFAWIRIGLELAPWIRIRIRIETNQCGSATLFLSIHIVLQGQAAWLIQEGKKPAGKGYDPCCLSTGGEGRTAPAGQDILLLQVCIIIRSRLTRLRISVADPVGLSRILYPEFFFPRS